MTEPYQPSEGLLHGQGSTSDGAIFDRATLEGWPSVSSRHRRRPVHSADQAQFRNWLISFAVLFIAVAAWSFASPLGSAPDEPAHLIRAASLVRGELIGKPIPHPQGSQEHGDG